MTDDINISSLLVMKYYDTCSSFITYVSLYVIDLQHRVFILHYNGAWQMSVNDLIWFYGYYLLKSKYFLSFYPIAHSNKIPGLSQRCTCLSNIYIYIYIYKHITCNNYENAMLYGQCRYCTNYCIVSGTLTCIYFIPCLMRVVYIAACVCVSLLSSVF